MHTPQDAEIPLLSTQREQISLLPDRSKNVFVHRLLHVFGPQFVPSQPKLKTIQMSVNWGTNKPVVVYPFDRIILTMGKKLGIHSTTWSISKTIYKGKISQTKRPRIVRSCLYDILEKPNYRNRKGVGLFHTTHLTEPLRTVRFSVSRLQLD